MEPEAIIAVLTAATALVAALIRLVFAVNSYKSEVNHRMDELLELTRTAAEARGRLEGPRRLAD
jgi:hypothetical protein